MTLNVPEKDMLELLSQLRKLTELIDPLKAILAAEATPGMGERIEHFLTEVTRIADQMDLAAHAMKATQESRAAIARIETGIAVQAQVLGDMASNIGVILNLLGAPLDRPGLG